MERQKRTSSSKGKNSEHSQRWEKRYGKSRNMKMREGRKNRWNY